MAWWQISVNGETFQSAGTGSVAVPAADAVALDVTPPPAPAGVSASGALVSNIITWTAPTYGNHAYAKVFRSATNNIGTAVMVGTTEASIYVDTVGAASSYYYWVKFVSTSDVDGPFNATAGTFSQTGNDPVRMLELLTGDPASSPYYGQFPFIVLQVPTNINGVTAPAGAYIRDAFIANGTISNAMIGTAAIDSAKIADAAIASAHIQNAAIKNAHIESLTADKIKTGTLAADTSITVGTTIEGLPALEFNGQGEVISNGLGGNKARLYSGDVEIYKNVPNVGVVKYKALSRVEVGVADNNVQVTIPGYFKSQPKIIVSPFSIGLYKSSFSNQDQSLTCQAQSIVESPTGSMVWKFTPVATLNLTANSGSTIVNQSSGVQTVNWTSSQYITPANCNQITPSVYLASNRGNGSSQYFFRSVRWRVEYLNAGSWVLGAWNTYNLGADANANVSANAVFNFPSSAAWTFRIAYEAFDTNGTLFGSVQYSFAEDDTAINGNINTATANGIANTDQSVSTGVLAITYATPAGWEVYQVRYDYDESHNFFGDTTTLGQGKASVAAPNYSAISTSAGTGGATAYVTRSQTVAAVFNANQVVGTARANNSGLSVGLCSSELKLKNARAHVWRRQPLANSTTPSNTFRLDSYNYTLTSAQVLATGSLNWVAVGD
jgi:hypothetical protein